MGPWLIPYSSRSLQSSSEDFRLNDDMTVTTNHKDWGEKVSHLHANGQGGNAY